MEWQANSGKFLLSIDLEQATQCTKPGEDATVAIAKLAATRNVSIQLDSIRPEDLREELRDYGAWSEVELADYGANRLRMLWLACGDIVEESARGSGYDGGRGD